MSFSPKVIYVPANCQVSKGFFLFPAAQLRVDLTRLGITTGNIWLNIVHYIKPNIRCIRIADPFFDSILLNEHCKRYATHEIQRGQCFGAGPILIGSGYWLRLPAPTNNIFVTQV